MTAAVFTQIADYFRKMHDDVVWPIAGPQTGKVKAGRRQPRNPPPPLGADKLAEFHLVLLKNYLKVVRVFDPERPCSSNDDCKNQGEICVDGECRRPDPGGGVSRPERTAYLLQGCTFNDDCRNQGEICVDGLCVPNPFSLVVVAATFTPDPIYFDGLEKAFFAYYTRIQDVITAGLGRDPSKIVSIRNVLMEMYADLAAAAGTHGCRANDDCAEGEVCVNGHCVPYPFRLAFSSSSTLMLAPWM